MRRYDCLKALAPRLGDELVITNLANTATEWRAVHPSEGNLYFVGMGMVTPYAIGLALALPGRRVLALDGDGGILFDLSALGTLAQTAPANLTVVVFDNGGYVSTGKLPAAASLSAHGFDIAGVARAAGVRTVHTVETPDEFANAVDAGLRTGVGSSLIVAKVDAAQADIGTTPMDSKENKYRFVRHIERLERTTILRPSAKAHGEPPKPDPASAAVKDGDDFARVLYDGLRENNVDFVVGLPCSGLVKAQSMCMADPKIRYVGVANEGTGLGLCAGAWLGGKRPAALVENFGMFAAAYQLLRGHYSYGIPTLVLAEYRGDAGDQEFFAESGDMTEGFLAALRINHRVIRELGSLKPAIRDGLRWMDAALRPYAVLPAYNLTRPRL
ncbi:MAG TPA: thiamine pyrophosphate-dependent enzyme [Alphaproteobacteria bacterium]